MWLVRKAVGVIMAFLPGACLAATPGSTGAGQDTAIASFIDTHCLRCHCSTKQEGGFRIDSLPRDFVDPTNAQRWEEVAARINAGEMPPKDEPRPGADDLSRIVDWISTSLDEGSAARASQRGTVALYRLSREEYAHTIYDLLGVHYDVRQPGALIEDPRWHGFDRIGSMLTLSPSHIDRYVRAAEEVVALAFPEETPQPVTGRWESEAGDAASDGSPETKYREILWPGAEGRRIKTRTGGTPITVRIRLSGLQPRGGRAPHLTVWDFTQRRAVFDEDIVAEEDRPTVVEFVTTSGGFQLLNAVRGFPTNAYLQSQTARRLVHSRQPRLGTSPTGYKLFDDDGQPLFPLLLVDSVEWQSVPMTDEQKMKLAGILPAGLARDAARPADPGARERLLAACRDSLARFAARAWRRPVDPAELDCYLDIVNDELDRGESSATAYRAALEGILVSKNFLYLVEGSAERTPGKITDWELASRLSYFLWSSLPDEGLLAAAEAGTLRQPEVLRAQLHRMTDDPRIERFVESFPRQWLQLHRVGMFPPDPKIYPDYDSWLERSMLLETQSYFAEVFSQNLPLREFLQSDWTMANARLASFYQLPPVDGSGFRRVALAPGDHRGGLLTHAAILSLTSDGTRHRPVHRGVWLSEAIFGRTPPPPPPNVEPLEPTPSDKPKMTIRQQIQDHATNATCAACHAKIDPLGFAFETYDAIGRWRTRERIDSGTGDDPPVDASGVLPNGTAFQGPEDFKRLLVDDIDRFAEAFVEQLATYALRRVMVLDDRAAIKDIAATSKQDGYRLRSLLENLVLSDLFQKQ